VIARDGAEALMASCVFLGGGIDALRSATARFNRSIESMVARDAERCPPPRRAVLLVHDTDGVRLALAHALSAGLGVPIVEAATVAEARVALRRDRPAAIVADYHLGDETSAQLLRDRPPWCRGTIVTARVDLDQLAGIAAGCGARLIQTPVTDDETDALVAAVRADLNGSET